MFAHVIRIQTWLHCFDVRIAEKILIKTSEFGKQHQIYQIVLCKLALTQIFIERIHWELCSSMEFSKKLIDWQKVPIHFNPTSDWVTIYQ